MDIWQKQFDFWKDSAEIVMDIVEKYEITPLIVKMN